MSGREPTEFGWWLLRRIAEHDLTQAQLARRVGVAQATISRWIHDDIRPDTESLAKLADALGLPHDDLLYRTGHATPTQTTGSAGTADILRRAAAVHDALTGDDRSRLESVLDAVIAPWEERLSQRRRRPA